MSRHARRLHQLARRRQCVRLVQPVVAPRPARRQTHNYRRGRWMAVPGATIQRRSSSSGAKPRHVL
eukprot:2697556-Pleurochrysis_carterae.AAC.1